VASVEDGYNFRRVHDRLTTSGLLSPDQLGALRRDGYDAVVNLLPDSNERAVTHEADIVRAQGVDYVYIPVDFAAPTRSDLQRFAEAMDELEGRTVHVHCAANYRVSAFYSLYALRRGWCTVEQADAIVRDVWDPAEHPAWSAFIAEEQARIAGDPA
jgi:protein tyrosine phosphatase (PTP) superfamily phosphohydrolase (DUF442 family)